MKIERNNIADYRTQDLIKDETFIDWVKAGKPQGNAWCKYIEKYPHLSLYVNEAQNVIQQISFRKDDGNKYRIERIKTALDASIKSGQFKKKEPYQLGESELHARGSGKRISFGAVAVAAVIALVIATIFVLNMESEVDSLSANVSIKKVTDSGQKLTVHLRDGSTVKMNAESSLTYDDYFSDTSRIVYLTGEAFFEVAKDSKRPFRVITENTLTTALGTAFNIKSDQVGHATAISLQSGKVSVENLTTANDVVFLEPGQQAYSVAEKPITVQDFHLDLLAWKEGVLIFNKDSHQTVFEELEKWFGVEINVQSTGRKQVNWDYTGRFENESLENILQSIGYVKKFTFEIENEEVIVILN